jgi:two-component system nitrogen regulation sensor histidine kinase NtrY
VSAGVIGLDAVGRIELPNRAADELLERDLVAALGRPLAELVPEFAALIADAAATPERAHTAEVQIGPPSRRRMLLARIGADLSGGRTDGFVLTFDDITALQSAQRKAAWADVARRIAHEIKNPLTPILLSAERLKRKYLGEIKNDPETFTTCTETIIRHVGDIGRMVDEFSSFARMPQPSIKDENLVDIARQVMFLHRTAAPEIRFDLDLPGAGAVRLACDARLVSQALVNLLKNAAESIQSRGAAPPGVIALRLRESPQQTTVIVEDNGRGLPNEGRERLVEPYVTTRAKGTGLGLAIVKKIMEDHGGELLLEDRDGGGARVMLVFNRGEARMPARAAVETGGPVVEKAAAHGA